MYVGVGGDGLLPILGADQPQVNNGRSAQISFFTKKYQALTGEKSITVSGLDWTEE